MAFTPSTRYCPVRHSPSFAIPQLSPTPLSIYVDHEYMNDSPAWVWATVVPKFLRHFLCPWANYSNWSMVRRSRKAVGTVYMYLNINTSVHVKEHHRLFVKSRGSFWYCWLYFKNTFIHSRTRGKVQHVCTQCVNTKTYEFSTNNGRRRRRRRRHQCSYCEIKGSVLLAVVILLCNIRLWILNKFSLLLQNIKVKISTY